MKIALVLIMVIIKFNVLFGQQYCSLYESALDDFIQNEWNKDIFKSECTGLNFNSKIKIEINVDQPSTYVDKRQVSHYLDTTLFNSNQKGNSSQEELDKINNAKSIFEGNCINVANYTNLIKVSKTEQSKELQASNYFMRMSALFFGNHYIYLSFWIKKSNYSSGSHIIYQFDSNFNIVKKWVYNMCDEVG